MGNCKQDVRLLAELQVGPDESLSLFDYAPQFADGLLQVALIQVGHGSVEYGLCVLRIQVVKYLAEDLYCFIVVFVLNLLPGPLYHFIPSLNRADLTLFLELARVLG